MIMVKELITRIKPIIRPIICIVVTIILITILYTCSCSVYKKQQNMNILPITKSEYKDPELVELNENVSHMKPIITTPEIQLSTEELKKKYSKTPNDYRFNICGETKVQDPRLENKNYDKPLGLMCRKSYRKNISEPIINNQNKLVYVRGHKECKA